MLLKMIFGKYSNYAGEFDSRLKTAYLKDKAGFKEGDKVIDYLGSR